MTSYLVTIATDHQELVAKCAHGMNEQLLRQVLMFYPLGKKKLKKSVGVGGGGETGGIQPSLGARFLFHSIWWCFPLFEF